MVAQPPPEPVPRQPRWWTRHLPRMSPGARRPRWWTWVRDAGIVVAVYFAVTAWQGRHALPSGGRVPELHLRSIDGTEVSLGQFRGKAVLVHFWATWCGVCRAELSGLESLSRDLPQNTALVSVVVDSGNVADIRRFVREHDISYPVLVADAPTASRFGVSVFPTDYYLSPGGTIESVTTGLSWRWAMWARLRWAR